MSFSKPITDTSDIKNFTDLLHLKDLSKLKTKEFKLIEERVNECVEVIKKQDPATQKTSFKNLILAVSKITGEKKRELVQKINAFVISIQKTEVTTLVPLRSNTKNEKIQATLEKLNKDIALSIARYLTSTDLFVLISVSRSLKNLVRLNPHINAMIPLITQTRFYYDWEGENNFWLKIDSNKPELFKKYLYDLMYLGRVIADSPDLSAEVRGTYPLNTGNPPSTLSQKAESIKLWFDNSKDRMRELKDIRILVSFAEWKHFPGKLYNKYFPTTKVCVEFKSNRTNYTPMVE